MFIPRFCCTRVFFYGSKNGSIRARWIQSVSTDHPMLAIQSRSRGPCLAEIGDPIPYAPCRVYLPTILQNWVIYGVNVGKYTIHGAYGIVITMKRNIAIEIVDLAMNSMVILHSYNGYDSIWIQSFTEIQSLIKLKHWGRCWENNLVGGLEPWNFRTFRILVLGIIIPNIFWQRGSNHQQRFFQPR